MPKKEIKDDEHEEEVIYINCRPDGRRKTGKDRGKPSNDGSGRTQGGRGRNRR